MIAKTQNQKNLILQIEHNMDVVYSYMNSFFTTYKCIMNNVDNVNIQYMFVELYWQSKLREDIHREAQINHGSNVRKMQSELLISFIQEYKKFLFRDLQNRRSSIQRFTQSRLTREDCILIVRIFGIANTDVFVQSKQAPKINALWNILNRYIFDKGQLRQNIQNMILSNNFAQDLAYQRESLKNRGLQTALEIFDEIFCWPDYYRFCMENGINLQRIRA